ncbi:MAG: hypothetical protein HPY46_03005 [Candidatus Aminicenantes bacterium]|nr:hypothetical protein [Candidatus Aminicenantes bacterium]
MSKHHLPGLVFLYLLAAILIGVSSHSQLREEQQSETQLEPGRNVNMVSGTTLPYGDPWLQRQNEPSIAVSTRNPLHLLAGANDYRTVDIPFSEGELPGKVQGAMAGDAWLGIYKSFDGGESWITSLLPGFPQDTSAEGMASPLKQFTTAADPIVRAGTNGLFYYSGMAFNRAQTMGGGSLFVARFIDNNNLEGGDPIKYLDTKIIDTGTSGQFIDMPRIAVDMPRGSGTISIDGQNIPRSNVYAAYTVFLGKTDLNVRSRIMFRRSTDCGTTWGSAIKISESQHIIQGATIAIDPNTGAVYVAFRRFLHPSQSNSIVVVKSNDFGQTFSAPVVIANINPFDQPATDAGGDNISDPAGPSFRTNSYPTMAVDNNGIVYVAWTERGWGPTGEARIVMSTSQGGSGWTTPRPVINEADSYSFQGHQFMPHLTFAQGKLVLVWYDQRVDECGMEYGHGNWISDNMPIRHTTDVRCAQANPGLNPVFQPSVQVSKYLWALKPGSDTELEQEQFNPPNFEMFKGGTTPFHGDYIEVAPSPQFVLGPNGWKFNTEPSPNAVFHAVWTDNRDVRPPADGKWTNYTPPASDQPGFGSVACSSSSPSTAGMRNQNIYTSSLVQGVLAASPSSSKTLGDLGHYYDTDNGLIPRAFVVFVQNPGADIKTFRLTIVDSDAEGAIPWIDGSFEELENLEELDVMIAPYSTVARTVFVRSSDEKASVQVDVVEIDGLGGEPVSGGLSGSVVLNPDPSSPVYAPSDEYHNPNIRNPNIVNWDELNPNIVNPNIRNPNIRNWDEINPNIVNPNIRNLNIVNPNIRNPNIVNPNIRNPNIVNPNIVNPNIRNYTEEDFDGAQVSDVVFTVKNEGNTSSTYTLKTYSKEALPDEVYAQLLVYRVHYTPSADYYNQTGSACELKVERHHQLILNVTNPNIRNPNIVNPNIRNPNIRNGGLDNATFAVPPGEEVEVILRVIDFEPETTQGQFRIMTTGQVFSAEAFAESLGFAVTSHAYNTQDAKTMPEEELTYPATATKLIISTSYLPDGVVGIPYSATLLADGGKTPYGWALTTGELPPGLNLDGSSGEIYGTPTTAGKYDFIVRVDDSAGDFDTQAFSIYIDSDSEPDALTITTTSLPSGVLNYWYGATLEAAGGVWPRTWSLAGGSLPPGLSLDSTGVISGKILQEEGQDYPTSYLFRARVNDKIGNTALRDFIIIVNINTKAYYTISGTVYDEFTGYPLGGVVMRGLPNTPVTDDSGYYSDQVPEGWSGTVTPFKAGHTFSPTSRSYAEVGSPQTSQDYNFGAAIFNLTISKAGTGTGTVTSSPAGVDCGLDCSEAYSASTSVQLTAAWAPGSMFAGWSGDVPAGHESDNPVTITMDGNKNLTATFNLAPVLVITTVAVFDGIKNTAYNTTLQFAGGVPPVTWSVLSGSLPSGLSLNSGTGQISGTPTVSGYFSFIVQAKDASLQTATKALSMTIADWVARYNGSGDEYDVVTAAAVDALGNVYVTGYSIGSGTGRDYATIKYDNAGVQQWVARYNGLGNGDDMASDIAVDSWGNVYVTGKSVGSGTLDDYATVKYNSSGIEQWVARYNGPANNYDWGEAIAVDSLGYVYITGSSVGNSFDYATIKYNSSGAEQWVSRFDGPLNEDDYASAIAVDSSGNIYVTGTGIIAPSRTFDFVTIKYNNGGIQQWASSSGTTGYEQSNDIAIDASGNIYLTGCTYRDGTGYDYFTVKFNSSGEIWTARYNGPANSDDKACSISLDPSGNVYITGYSQGSGTGNDYATVKYNSSGVEQWVARYNGPVDGEDLAFDITVNPLGDVYVTGRSEIGPTDWDYATIKYNSSGSQQWVARYNGPGNDDDLGQSIAIDPMGNVYVAGSSYASESGTDYTTLRYTQSFPSTLFITTDALDIGYVGTPYAATVWAFGGSGSRSWSIISGSLPPGMNLSPTTGIIAGTPTTPGTYNFTTQVVDGSLTATKPLSITISPSSAPLESFIINAPENGFAGTPFSVTITAKDAGGNTTTNVTGETALTVDSGTISPTSIPAAEFQDDGVWTGNITLSADGNRTITATNSGKTGSDTIRIWALITSATDPNEGAIPDGKDFESIHLYRSNNRLRSEVKFYDIITLSYPFFIYVDVDGDSTPEIRITCGLTGFQARTYPAGELIYAGTPSVIKDTYIMEYIWTDVFPTSPIRIWLLADDRDGYDKLPDGTGVIIVNF